MVYEGVPLPSVGALSVVVPRKAAKGGMWFVLEVVGAAVCG